MKPKIKMHGIQVSKIYAKDNKINFIEHLGYKIQIHNFENKYYLIVDPVRFFTKNGFVPIWGKSAKALHTKFPPRFEYNDVVRNKVKKFLRIINIDSESLFERRTVLTSDWLSVKINKKPTEEMIFDGFKDHSIDDFIAFEDQMEE